MKHKPNNNSYYIENLTNKVNQNISLLSNIISKSFVLITFSILIIVLYVFVNDLKIFNFTYFLSFLAPCLFSKLLFFIDEMLFN